jgi:hypothetical protein
MANPSPIAMDAVKHPHFSGAMTKMAGARILTMYTIVHFYQLTFYYVRDNRMLLLAILSLCVNSFIFSGIVMMRGL